ncbi:DUF1716-domain-containing protein [Melanomma pulvis-pyrius CBS 109.77]|uniref:DUF1716-domain-containing protein n=1 Tax=Melanomma pulvis-pyrius CBS 109.77 TaxID=1314802 RepID=A0A6A6XE29_9PLEO|nr:DUF1716-domain-containing protein [Melanomma pulvis-pyrius CBS 109.77]
MTSIDDIFKRPASATKRKFENPSERDPTQAWKSVKISSGSDVKQSSYTSIAGDENDEDEAGPTLPPGLDDEPGDDEEGRFFGGGLDEDAKDAIDYLDGKDGEEAILEEQYDVSWLRKLSLNFEKKMTKNAALRAKHESDPTKFMASEADLDETIKGFSILSEHSELYAEFANSSAAASLVALLAHDNTDIAIGAIEIISELTDEDIVAEQGQWDVLVDAFMEADLLSLLISNFARFDESVAADTSGVYHSLSVIENLLSQPANTDLIGKESALLTWLLTRIQKPEKSTTQNKQYASEILSILTQSSTSNRRRVIEANGVELLLTNLAPYRRMDPQKESEEEEYMENLFGCLTSLVDESEGKVKFLEAEGVELCLLMVRDAKTSKSRALKVLDHACGYAESPPPAEDAKTNGSTSSGRGKKTMEEASPNNAAAVCEKFVESRGLKPLFSTFVKTKKHDPETTEHILGIFASLLRSLPGNSDQRFRVLAKFLEKDFEKITKLVSLRRDYASRVAAFDTKLEDQKKDLSKEEQEELELENIPTRLDEGLYCLERIDAILAWLIAEDDGAKKAVVKALAERDENLADLRRTLQAQLDGVLEVEPAEREMLEALIGFLA